ncbi:sulfotransferase family protein [Paracoccus sp. (in: a-proteobacteria)]|uniref:sulfotransferase family protein n=1 Tax=Paracoccus sp. TaxID=267 RepID=UPI003A8C6C4B
MDAQDRPTSAPDFYVVGAAKAGTTAVWTWLRGHPQVFLPDVKEPGYFAFAGRSAVPREGPYDPDYTARIATDAAAYHRLYAGAGRRIAGDVSPVYLYDDQAAKRIAAARPDARIVILLRDPVTRAFSQYLHHLRDGLEPCHSFESALEAEQARLRDGWSWAYAYAQGGDYAAQIDRYLRAFPRDSILFLDYVALQSRPETCWRQLCGHLGLGDYPMPPNDRVNATATLSALPRFPALTRAIRHPGVIQRGLKRLLPVRLRGALRRGIDTPGQPVPVLAEATRRDLARRYAAERARVAAQSGLDLDAWAR